MRKFYIIFFGLLLCIDTVNAASRTQNITPTTTSRQAISHQRNNALQNRTNSQRVSVISDSARKTTARSTSTKTVTGRTSAQTTTSRSATRPALISRATATVQPKAFGNNYNACRDAYFTCMDQFCATQNETYRRCVCSSKLQSVQKQEQTLAQTADSLKNFDELNISMIPKTSDEVHAMITKSEGEANLKRDVSLSANVLKNISNVLSESKSKSLSTQGTLDIAGDIKSIWNTTHLIGGSNIANLTGENLYNAVHTQCYDLVSQSCTDSDMKMISSAYGMYIENDCAVLAENLKVKTAAANTAIRDTRQKMHDARLENYNAHNSTSINDCIANVRNEITADTACGEGYVHCLDFSGKYLNLTTGEPIYSPEFYQIENQISLSGDTLKNKQNSVYINQLNKKRDFAKQPLDLCQENADDVWDEFLRQSLVEIYQEQQKRVQSVKNECLQVVNECYLNQSEQLKKLVSSDSKTHFNHLLELSEEMCADKLNSCSNLYGGGDTGLNILVATMSTITKTTIEQSCTDLLNTFVQNLCAPPVNDSSHSYPYGCRAYAPGEARYALVDTCNSTLVNPFSKTNILIQSQNQQTSFQDYLAQCKDYTKIYTSCKYGYYLYANCNETNGYCYNKDRATECRVCPGEAICSGGTSAPQPINQNLSATCGEYYIGSLYQQLVRYALQNCRRPSENADLSNNTPSTSLLADIDRVLNSVRASLVDELSKECANQSGTWIDIPWADKDGDGTHDLNGDVLLNNFYLLTGANALWGYCRQ
ncbi:MAG: hypothetical protein IKF41_01305 [Alphaproteobacteria bacterium]|nr:hypothetical protein [Alphaproteobacteria bacterium]